MTEEIKQALHEHYLTMRKMHLIGLPHRCIQKSFEELIYGVMRKNSWRPTHISESAKEEILSGNKRSVQRAHGIMSDRLDRHKRTEIILTGDEQPFDKWFDFFVENDKTVLITKKEHNEKIAFNYTDLITLPNWSEELFENAGFSVRIRKGKECEWLRKNDN
jgi:hypothetical protein